MVAAHLSSREAENLVHHLIRDLNGRTDHPEGHTLDIHRSVTVLGWVHLLGREWTLVVEEKDPLVPGRPYHVAPRDGETFSEPMDAEGVHNFCCFGRQTGDPMRGIRTPRHDMPRIDCPRGFGYAPAQGDQSVAEA